MNIQTIPQTKETNRRALVVAAAQALCIAPQLSRELAGVDTAKFVQSVRGIYKSHGFHFTDEDLREMQWLIRASVAGRAQQGEMPVLDKVTPTVWTQRPTPPPPVVEIANGSGERFTVDKQQRVF